MPITSNADYIPTIDEFHAHWTVANDTETFNIPIDDGMVLFGELVDLRNELDGFKTTLEVRLNDLEIARVTLNQAREAAADRLADFNRRIRALFPNDARFNKLPLVPTRTAGRDPFLTAMDDAKDLWTRVNALPASPVFTAPLLLHGGFTLAAFTTRRTALDAAFTARGTADTRTGVTRAQRDEVQVRALRILTGYRLMVEALFPPDSVIVATLPALRPPEGHTPAPVAMAATWIPAETKAEIEWEASADPNLQNYQLRAVPGPDYNAADATTLHTFLPADPRTFQTGAGFAIPGAAMTYKLFVRLTTGNESGSEAVTVTRPV